ncbi:MAG: hypothetical protein KDC98_17055, partial [Planctomycetes bacterium]|nr:hypothetical protein [Planctomycetota bacterium]
DADVGDFVDLLDGMRLCVEMSGESKAIRFRLGRIKGDKARIHFSAQGLSVFELLLVTCHRASLTWRIEGETVVLDDA